MIVTDTIGEGIILTNWVFNFKNEVDVFGGNINRSSQRVCCQIISAECAEFPYRTNEMRELVWLQTNIGLGRTITAKTQLITTSIKQYPRRYVNMVLLGLELAFPRIEVVPT
jgi:hypothetical protein